MPVDVSKLKPYQQKLFRFIEKVKEGEEVKSGSPAMPNMKPMDYDELKAREKQSNAKLIIGNDLFTTLAGMSHENLLITWKTDPTFTTCNGLIGTCATAMGVSALKSLENVGGKPSPLSLGQFEIATILAARGLSAAWIPNASGARPRYGDIFRAEEYHMGVSLDFEGDKWNTIESGQGGRRQGFDMLKRKSQTWGARNILGWVDIETLLSEKTVLPSWLGGWWKVNEIGHDWYYYFAAENCVYCQMNAPVSTLFAPTARTAFYGSFSIVAGKYQTVQIRWFTDDPDETLQVITAMKKPGEKARDPSRDTLKGTTFGGKPMSGSRLPGPAQTGLDYAHSHPHGGSGDSTAQRR